MLLLPALPRPGLAQDALVGLANGGFERVPPGQALPDGWSVGIAPGTRATLELDRTVAHSGTASFRISDQSPTQPYIYALLASEPLPVQPETTYEITAFVKGLDVGRCALRAEFGGVFGQLSLPLPVGTYEWRQVRLAATTAPGCTRLRIQVVADGLIESLWIDDVRITLAPRQEAGLAERRYRQDVEGWFPRTPGTVPEHLVVVDGRRTSFDADVMLAALQGLANRQGPRLYLIHKTNPAGMDETWLQYMQEKGYTGTEVRLDSPRAALERFRPAVRGVIIHDPEVPGTLNAAWMLAGLRNALPASPEYAAELGLPVVEDLRGRFRLNVEAYRYVYAMHWDRMNHFLLAWQHPLDNYTGYRDYTVQWNVFTFWISGPGDGLRGADPQAEEAFAHELLANTPGNTPVMGWMKYTDRWGIDEYDGVRLLSEYAKWVPGTAYTSNLSVHSAIRPPTSVFRQRFRQSPATTALDPGKLYLATSIMDSGDAQWYFQLYQRGVWADPHRGSSPTGYCLNMTLIDTLPLVAQWYYENMTPNDSFFGLLYMNAPVYASRFRQADRDRIWDEYVRRNDEYCRRLDLDGLELYTGGSGGPAADEHLLRRFTRGMTHLNYLLVGLGRHADVTPANASFMLDNTVVFRTLTNFLVWTDSSTARKTDMARENTWLLGEILANAPAARPAFVSAMAISWSYYPSWVKDLQSRLPADYVPVSPNELARLFREQARRRDDPTPAPLPASQAAEPGTASEPRSPADGNGRP